MCDIFDVVGSIGLLEFDLNTFDLAIYVFLQVGEGQLYFFFVDAEQQVVVLLQSLYLLLVLLLLCLISQCQLLDLFLQ